MNNRATPNLESFVDERSGILGSIEWLPEYVDAIVKKEVMPDFQIRPFNEYPDLIFFFAITGWFIGSTTEFYDALERSGITNETPLRLRGFFVKNTTMIDSSLSLSGWNPTIPESLLGEFEWTNTYFKYKSLMLIDSLSEEAIEILVDNTYISPGRSLSVCSSSKHWVEVIRLCLQ